MVDRFVDVFFSSRRRHTRLQGDWSSDVCSSDVLMYVFTQRLFPVPYEWRRLALVVLSAAALIGAGDALLPASGFVGLASRTGLWLPHPAALLALGFLPQDERSGPVAMLPPPPI